MGNPRRLGDLLTSKRDEMARMVNADFADEVLIVMMLTDS
jgi:hypothetical protein